MKHVFRNSTIKAIAFVVLTLLFACKKSDGDTDLPPVVTPPISTARVSGPSPGTFTSDRKYNLNVIYFVPSDVQPAANYQKRLSDLLLWGQNWYKEKMAAMGYADKTFGLYTNAAKTDVRLIIVYGSLSKDQYQYETSTGGASRMQDEINSFFVTNPALKTGDHNLIIAPSYFMKADDTPGGGAFGPPFYGLGKTCFALDYENLDIKHLGKTDVLGNEFSTWFGGMMHELGHGLNLPHNSQKVSETSDASKGMSMMWAGNSTLGKSPTFLTAADCAVLNVNQIFNKTNDVFYGSSTGSIIEMNASFDVVKQAIVLSGKYTSSVPVSSVIYYNDPNVNNEGTGANRDYNAVTWESKTINNNSFYIEMPIAELQYKDNATPYELRVKLVQNNGNVISTNYAYSFLNGSPVINFGDRTFLNRTTWTISGFSTAQGSYVPSNVLDGNINTYWHTSWDNAQPHPHFVAIKTGAAAVTANGLSINTRQDTQAGAGKIKDFRVETSNDGITWITIYTGTMVANGVQNFSFNGAKTFNYFKIVSLSDHLGEKFASLSEVNLF